MDLVEGSLGLKAMGGGGGGQYSGKTLVIENLGIKVYRSTELTNPTGSRPSLRPLGSATTGSMFG